MTPSNNYLTIQEAAELLRCATKTIRRRIEEGSLKAYRNGRRIIIPREQVFDYIEARPVR
jgi:excisionase family DNA binding protein